MTISESSFVWIKTQDGSPTLWSNEIGEPYRSVKGAFHESLLVFVKPAIEFAQKYYKENARELVVGEFGLGAGTNWIFFSAIATALGIPFQYYAIEKDPAAFELALGRWREEEALLKENIQKHLGLNLEVDVEKLEAPHISKSLEEFTNSLKTLDKKCDIWFHDPFGSGVNPEGYSDETLGKCSQTWQQPFIGLSYACNGAFQKSLRTLNIHTQVVELKSPPLKKESLIFSR